jgi:hypothetical protein
MIGWAFWAPWTRPEKDMVEMQARQLAGMAPPLYLRVSLLDVDGMSQGRCDGEDGR